MVIFSNILFSFLRDIKFNCKYFDMWNLFTQRNYFKQETEFMRILMVTECSL